MTITVNGQAVEFSGSVADLLAQRLGDPRPHGVAVAIGEDVLPRDRWSGSRLRDGDTVEIVTAVQGG